MLAVRLYAKGDLRVEEAARPVLPAADWVRVRVTHAGICGSDLHNFRTGQWITRSPSIAGHEFAGVVSETGPACTGLAAGDRVAGDSRFWCGTCEACRAGRQQLCASLGFVGEACDGCFAEEIVLPQRLLHRVPRGLPSHLAATAEPVAVALHAVRRLRLAPGEPVLVMGCGPIGGFAAVVLRHLGLGPVAVADRNEARAALVAQVTGAAVAAVEAAQLRSALHGRAPRAAIDATGSIAALRQLIAAMPGGGSVALVGIAHGRLDLDPNVLVERELSLIGCHAFADELPAAIDLIGHCAGMIGPLIDREIGLADVPEAYGRIAAGELRGLKTLIRVSASE